MVFMMPAITQAELDAGQAERLERIRREGWKGHVPADMLRRMATVQINVPDDLVARAERAGWRDVGQYLLSLMRADLEGVTPEIESLLMQRADAPNAGEMTETDFESIRERVRSAARERGR